MIKCVFKGLGLMAAFLSVGSCAVSQPVPVARAQEYQPQIDMPTSVVVCRSKQCAPAKLSMSKEYIYNSLIHMLSNNTHEKALVCQANANTHTCTEDYLTLPITVGVTPANMYINDVEIEDVSVALNRNSVDLLLSYGVSYNGQTPVCKPAKSLIYVKNAQNIILEDSGYMCKMTTIGNTTIKTLFAIDYIDLDYGFIGGYYSIGLSGPAYGGRSGYMLIKLKNDAYPLSPDLILKEGQAKDQKAEQMPYGVPVDMGTYEYAPCGGELMQCPDKYYTDAYGQQYMIVEDQNMPMPRATGVVMPQANNSNKAPVNTRTLKTTVEEQTTMSVYDTPESETGSGTDYKGVEVFPIYQKKK